MAELKEEEEKLRLLIKKIDIEIAKFEELLETAQSKQGEVEEAVADTGLQRVPVNIKPNFGEGADLVQELNSHVLNLNKLKNFINGRLEAVIKEEELLEQLQKKFGKKVEIKKLDSGEFEVDFKDADTEKIFQQVQKSKRDIDEIKKIIQGP